MATLNLHIPFVYKKCGRAIDAEAETTKFAIGGTEIKIIPCPQCLQRVYEEGLGGRTAIGT